MKRYLRHGGQVVLRVVSFHFDDTTEEGLRLWERQDGFMRGAFGSVEDLEPLILENPSRLIRGKKQRTPPGSICQTGPTTKPQQQKTTSSLHTTTTGLLVFYTTEMRVGWVVGNAQSSATQKTYRQLLIYSDENDLHSNASGNETIILLLESFISRDDERD